MKAAYNQRSNSTFFTTEKTGDLKARLLFVMFMFIIYRIGTYIPLPGINPMVLGDISKAQASGVLGMLNMFTGGALSRMSIFALNIMPYIMASIIMQLMTIVSDNIASLKKEGEQGRKKISQYTRYLTIPIAIVQGYGIAIGAENLISHNGALVVDPGLLFRFFTIVSLTGGTVLVMWIAEQINVRGIGNGSSLIIFAGIVSGLPEALVALFELGRTGALSLFMLMFILMLVLSLITFIVFVEKAQRKISVNYPKRQIGNKIYGDSTTHLPFKINTSGVIPAIFGSSLLLFPATIMSFGNQTELSEWKQNLMIYLGHGQPLYVLLYASLISFFCFYYTSVIFNPDETAENLKKNGGVIIGRRPGAHTAQYLDYILTRVTVVGAIYLVIVCVIPEILMSQYSIPFYLGGTSLLIIVNVVIDFFTQIQSHLYSAKYESLLKRNRIR
jgi:preprotein translocase subunit SecY